MESRNDAATARLPLGSPITGGLGFLPPVTLFSILDDLSDFAIFGGIDAETLRGVADLFDEGSYAAGTRIIEEGTRGNRLYIVASGNAEVTVRCPTNGGDQVESVLATHGRGATFGEMELLDTQVRSATVTAIERTETIELTNMGLLRIFERDPDTFRMLIMNSPAT